MPRVVLITGAARGIGRAIAEDMARDHAVAVSYLFARDEAEGFAGAGPDRLAVQCDLRRDGAADALIAAVVERFGKIDLLVNNAGPGAATPVDTLDSAVLAELALVNQIAPMLLIRAVLPFMPRGGAILNISSVNAAYPPARVAGFAASKAALEAATIALAKELGPRGIRVNALAPGAVDLPHKPRPKDVRDRLSAETPLGRTALPEDITGPARFLLSDASAFVTGEVLRVAGGYGR